MSVDFKFDVKRKYVINGKEYASVEEMPEDVRTLYEQALAKASASSDSQTVKQQSVTFTLNGKELKNLESLPFIGRILFKTLSKNMPAGTGLPPAAGTEFPPVDAGSPAGQAGRPGSYNPLVKDGSKSAVPLILFIAVLLGILGFAIYYLRVLAG